MTESEVDRHRQLVSFLRAMHCEEADAYLEEKLAGLKKRKNRLSYQIKKVSSAPTSVRLCSFGDASKSVFSTYEKDLLWFCWMIALLLQKKAGVRNGSFDPG